MEEKEDRELKTLEQEVFKALDHQTRRDILRCIGERKESTFTEIMNTVRITRQPNSVIPPEDPRTIHRATQG